MKLNFSSLLRIFDRNKDGVLNVEFKYSCLKCGGKGHNRLVINLTDEEMDAIENYNADYTINIDPRSVYRHRARACVQLKDTATA